MNLRELFPKFNVTVKVTTLADNYGEYWDKKDIILLNKKLYKQTPGLAKIVLLHEMMHATASSKRLMRFDRLASNFGEYTKDSLAYRVEECIAEVACMVAAMKLGLLNEYSQHVILPGLEKHYSEDMYIPIREVRAAVKYFAEDDTSFEEEIREVKSFLEAYADIKFQDTYSPKQVSA
jgi:hypothetical protein